MQSALGDVAGLSFGGVASMGVANSNGQTPLPSAWIRARVFWLAVEQWRRMAPANGEGLEARRTYAFGSERAIARWHKGWQLSDEPSARWREGWGGVHGCMAAWRGERGSGSGSTEWTRPAPWLHVQDASGDGDGLHRVCDSQKPMARHGGRRRASHRGG